MRIDRALTRQGANPGPHVHGTRGAIHERGSGESPAVIRKHLRSARGGVVDLGNKMHGAWQKFIICCVRRDPGDCT